MVLSWNKKELHPVVERELLGLDGLRRRRRRRDDHRRRHEGKKEAANTHDQHSAFEAQDDAARAR
jgi:hypothetical protein